MIRNIAFAASALAIAGCSGTGTTYGTGTSHEEQTMKSMYNMLSIKPPEQPNIDYSARPDLVMPANKQVLPTPEDQSANAGDQNWPVSPEQRIAAVRNSAPQPHTRSGNLPTEYLTSEKEGIRNSAGLYAVSRQKEKDGGQFLREIQQESITGSSAGEEARRRRGQLTYSSGPQRKFLTEPPKEYRAPAETAEAGTVGLTSEELAKLEAKQKATEKAERDGFWTD
jgi:hypothetical protein